MYTISLFTHIVAALGLFVAAGLGAGSVVARLPRVRTRDEAVSWMSVMTPLRALGPVSLVLILASGLYMAAVGWGFDRWTGAALIGLAVLLVLGELLTGRTMLGLGRALSAERQVLSPAFRERLQI